MATHKSSEKRARQTVKRTARNNGKKSALKTFEKNLLKAIAQKDPKLAAEALRTLASKFDKAAQKGVVHMKTASRKLSRLSKQVSSIVSK